MRLFYWCGRNGLQITAQAADFRLDFHYAYGAPQAVAQLKSQPVHFRVDEQLGFERCGHGEHLYLLLRKTGLNSADLARQLAEHFGVKAVDVGYAGMKDKHAVATQWFSLYLPKGDDAAVNSLAIDGAALLRATRHTHKLRRGQHCGNHFQILLSALVADAASLEARLQVIAQRAVPN